MFYSSTQTEQLIALLYPKLSHPQKSRFSHFFNTSNPIQVNYSFPVDSLSSFQITKPKNRLAISTENIDSGIDTRTSIMIKNLPTSLSKDKATMWIQSICDVDYVYIPVEETGNKILGFAFVNVINFKDILLFCDEVNSNKNLTNVKKVEICYSKMQGVGSLMKAFGKEFLGGKYNKDKVKLFENIKKLNSNKSKYKVYIIKKY